MWPTIATAQVHEAALAPAGFGLTQFGRAVALSGATLAIGAPTGSESGSVVVLTLEVPGWTLQAALQPADATENDAFGHSVALDVDALIAGAWGWTDGSDFGPGAERGAAYVFRRTGSTWTEEAAFHPEELQTSDHFGRAVALDGDIAAVGAPEADPFGERSGRVWIFQRTAGVWSEAASLTAPDGGPAHRFGEALGVSGNTLVIGAPGADGAVAGSGAAYAFVNDGSAWVLQQKLWAPSGQRDDRFAASLGLEGDAVAVGVPRDDPGGTMNAGVVAIFRRVGGTWAQEAQLVAPQPRPVDNLGTSVALQGDLVVATAPDVDSVAAMGGAAYVFRRSAGIWGLQAELLAPATTIGDALGISVALDGDRTAISTVWRGATSYNKGGVDIWTGLEAP